MLCKRNTWLSQSYSMLGTFSPDSTTSIGLLDVSVRESPGRPTLRRSAALGFVIGLGGNPVTLEKFGELADGTGRNEGEDVFERAKGSTTTR
jgi:hypothetical protein